MLQKGICVASEGCTDQEPSTPSGQKTFTPSGCSCDSAVYTLAAAC